MHQWSKHLGSLLGVNWNKQQVESASEQMAGLREEISRIDAFCYMARQATARATMLETKLVQLQTCSVGIFLLFRNMLDSRSSNHADEAVSESSQSRQPKHIRENTPRPEQATDRLQWPQGGTSEYRPKADEAQKCFLKFRPLEFYGEAEQEIKAKLFLEQLSDIYDTLKYEDALRVTFAAFRLHGMVKDWWLRASETRALKN
ncbi:hypothetical protein M9H77_04056 [Catharanthus roseus]|uniref:Uncharacterized protein n=1 Tax=Catharanthus roseus TaxID=4058 RepID=A0ACC0CDI8_CATRO|nr:hypothetical protein M9H77_04056 [Catharanthus roseus]